MASPSERKMVGFDEAEVTSRHQNRDAHHQRDERDGDVQDQLEIAFPLMRQSSIYSLTLDEIQNTVCERGKTFGSMNMDEFLTNIWSVEEGFAASVPANSAALNAVEAANGGDGAAPSLQRQGSLTLPAPLCRKTVDEVWAEIHREQAVHHQLDRSRHGNAENAPRQPTFGEMTLEDFLIKAGVVREGYGPSSPHPPPTIQQQYGLQNYQMGAEGPGFGQVVGVGYGDHQELGTTANGVYHTVVGDGAGYGTANGIRRMGNVYGARQLRVGSPASPVSSDGLAGEQVDNGGMDAGGMKGGRKRMADGGVEKVVERRQRRMIKNRESAARSRARKQAYTVELEAELNQLKEENARLKEEERKVQAMRKQLQLLEAVVERARSNANLAAARSLRRCESGPW